MTFGECSPIINLNLSNQKDLEKLFGPAPFQIEQMVSRTITLVNCVNDHVPDASRRLEVLIFALDQQILLKERFLLPALRRYEQDHSLENLRVVQRYAEIVSGKIEAAIIGYGALGEHQYAIEREQGALAVLDQNSTELLSETLDKKLRLTLQLRATEYGRIITSVREYLETYEDAIDRVKWIRDELKKELAAQGKRRR
jgi:hypothetical protein